MKEIRGVEKAIAFMAVFLALAGSCYAIGVVIDYPAGGENISEPYMDINWTTSGTCNDWWGVNLYYDNDKDDSYGEVTIAEQETNDGYYNWSLQGVQTGSYYAKVYAVCNDPPETATNYSEGRFTKLGYNLTYASNTWTVTVDENRAPNVTVIYPNSSEIVRNHYIIQFNASDPDNDSLFAHIYYSDNPGDKDSLIFYSLDLSDNATCTDDDSNTSTWNSCIFDWNSSGIEGYYYIDIEITDTKFNTTDSSEQFLADNTPNLTVDYPNGGEVLTARYVDINWTANDIPGFTITKVDIYYDNDNSISNGRTLISAAEANDGTYLWDMRYVQIGSYYISIDAYSNGIDNASNNITLNTTDYSDALFTKAGYELTYTSNNITFDVNENRAPNITVVEPNGGEEYNTSTTIRFNVSDLDGDILEADIYYSNAKGGFENLLIGNLDLADDSVCTDSDINMTTENNCSYYWNTTGINEVYYIDIIVRDTIHESNDSSDDNFTIDNIPFISNVSASSITNSSVIITWQTNEITNSTVKYSLDLSYNETYSNTSLVLNHVMQLTGLSGNKQYFFMVESCDNTGNCVNSTGYNFTLLNNLPFLNVTYPNGGELLTTPTVYINWTAADADGDNITLDIYYDNDNEISNGRTLIAANTTNNSTYPWSLQGVQLGDYYISITAWSYDLIADANVSVTDYSDASFTKGNILYEYTSNNITFSVNENRAPNVTVVEPNGGELYNTSLTIRFNVSDLDGDILEADIYYSNAKGGFENLLIGNLDLADDSVCTDSDINMTTENNCSYYWNTTGINEVYYIDIIVRDTIHESNDSSDDNFTIDNIPFISNVSASNITNSSVIITWQTNEPANSTVRYGFDTGYNETEGNSTLVVNHSIQLANLSGNRQYFFMVESCDSTGNCINSTGYNFTLLNNLPVLNIIYPNGGEQFNTTHADINWTAADADGDNITITIYYDNDNVVSNGRTLIISGEENDGYYNWDLEGVHIGSYYISIDAVSYDMYSMQEANVTDYSDAMFVKLGTPLEYISNAPVFTVRENTAPGVIIESPNGGEVFGATVPLEFNVSDNESDQMFGTYFVIYNGSIYRRKLAIKNPFEQALYDYPINITIDTAALYQQGKMRKDGKKFRVAIEGEEGVRQELPYYNATPFNNESTVIWFEIDLASQELRDDVYIYYGDDAPIATNQSAVPDWSNLQSKRNFLRSQDVESILEEPSYPARYSNDGNYATRWRSQYTSPPPNTTSIDWLKYTLDDTYLGYMIYYRLTGEGAANTQSSYSMDGINYTLMFNDTFTAGQTSQTNYFEPLFMNYFFTDVKSIITYAELYEVEVREPELLEVNISAEEPVLEYVEITEIDLSDSAICTDPDYDSNTTNNCTYPWNVTIHDGSYHICLRITDTLAESTDCSDGEVVINNLNDTPRFVAAIPNQTWARNNNITLNFTDYFFDPDADDLSFEATPTVNITIIIDNVTDTATLVPDTDWYGVEHVVFTAYEPSGANISSNNVTLNVTVIGFTIRNLDPALDAVLSDNESVNVEVVEQLGAKDILLKKGAARIANFTVNFTDDLYFDDVWADTNDTEEYGKAFVFINSTAHPEVSYAKTLYIPALQNTGDVYVCPNATSIDDVNLTCPGLYILAGLVPSAGYYNISVNGTGAAESDLSPPDITIISPGNNSLVVNNTVTFRYNATDSTGIANCSLVINWTVNQTNSSINTSAEQSFVQYLEDAGYVWSINCTDNSSNYNTGTSGDYNLDVDHTAGYLIPVINWIDASPEPQGLGENVTITANVTDENGQANIAYVRVGITPPAGSQANYTMANISTDVWAYYLTSFTNGTYSYTVYAADYDEFNATPKSGAFDTFADIYINIRTLNNTYVRGEMVNITDPR